MRNLTEFHSLVWEARSPIDLIYVPDDATAGEEAERMWSRYYPEDLGPAGITGVRIDNLLMSGVEAIRKEYDMGKSECIRMLIRLGMNVLDGEFVDPAECLSLPLDKDGGVGGSAPYGSTEAGKPSATGTSMPHKRRASPSLPHAKQNPEAA